MWTTLLDIIIVIMAFVFVVLTNATIEEESAIIGTLLASGYRKREIILHYLALPAIVNSRGGPGMRARRGVLHRAHAQPLLRLLQPAALPRVLELGIFFKCAVVPTAALILITLVGLLHKMGRNAPAVFAPRPGSRSGPSAGYDCPQAHGLRCALPPAYLPAQPPETSPHFS